MYFFIWKKIFNVFKTRAAAISVISYAILGLMANLLTFYYAIQTGNASAATILQYLSPLFIVLGGIVFMHRRPFRSDIIAFIVALIGVALCITRGNFTQLALPFVSLLWGVGIWNYSCVLYLSFHNELLMRIRQLLSSAGGR